MKRITSCLLALLMLLVLTVPAYAADLQPLQDQKRPVSILILFTLDSKIPKTLKTYTMAHYIATFDEEEKAVRFTTLPYNLAVAIESKGAAKTVQLQTVCHDTGVQGILDVLKSNFGITIDYWIMTNMAPVPSLVQVIGGIPADITSLDINKQASYAKKLTSKAWENVTQTGLQTLSGIQAVGYLVDTTYGKPTIEEEEIRFRERQQVFTRGIISGLGNLRLTAEGLMVLVDSALQGNYSTNIAIKGLIQIAEVDPKCFQSEPQYLHVPQQIFTVKASNGWESLGYTPEDAQAVRQFLGQ